MGNFNFAGHVKYWPLSGKENTFTIESTIGTNNYLVPIKDLNIFNRIRDVVYLKALERFFFLKQNMKNKIHSQYFPSHENTNQHYVKLGLDKAKARHENNEYEIHELPEEQNILKLACSEQHLFALVYDSSKLSVVKISVGKEGFNFFEDNYKELIIEYKNIDKENIRFEVFDIDPHSTKIYLLNNNEKILMEGVFNASKKSKIIELKKVRFNSDFCIDSFDLSFYNNKLNLALLDKDAKLIHVLQHNNNKNTFFQTDQIELGQSVKYVGIEFFHTKSKQLRLKETKEFIINQILIYSEHFIWNYDLDTKKMNDLFGQGSENVSNANVQKKLKEYRFYNMNLLVAIHDRCVIFGSILNQEVYAILLEKTRELFFLNVQNKNYLEDKNDQFTS